MQITYVNVGKEAYLLEVPESLRGKVPRDYELRSSKKVTAFVADHTELLFVLYTCWKNNRMKNFTVIGQES